jgi:DNA mismatch endonuclease (patch repair protein)
LGFRYRLHASHLPGTPDLAFARLKKAVFVHGCFWHQHSCKRGQRQPKSNRAYWLPKLANNRKRDLLALRRLRSLGWEALVVWECQLGDSTKLERRLVGFLERQSPIAKSKRKR